MAVKVVVKPDSRYLQERSGAFRPIENLSITASTPAYPAVLHKTRRTMILADDHTHAVIALDKDMLVSRNADLSVVLIAYAAGHLVAAIANALETLFWGSLGGMPSDWITRDPPALLSEDQVEIPAMFL